MTEKYSQLSAVQLPIIGILFSVKSSSSYLSKNQLRAVWTKYFVYLSEYYEVGTGKTVRKYRPVINLRSDIQITQGDGSQTNPYVIE